MVLNVMLNIDILVLNRKHFIRLNSMQCSTKQSQDLLKDDTETKSNLHISGGISNDRNHDDK